MRPYWHMKFVSKNIELCNTENYSDPGGYSVHWGYNEFRFTEIHKISFELKKWYDGGNSMNANLQYWNLEGQ